MPDSVPAFYQAITDFIFPEDEPESSDIIFIPGCSFPQVARRGAELFKAGFATLILPSGRYPKNEGSYSGPYSDQLGSEWEMMRKILMEEGVREEFILREDKATFTYENAIFSRRVTDGMGLKVRKAILCTQAFHSRRALLYYQQQFPHTRFFVVPAVTGDISRDNWFYDAEKTDRILGEVERIGQQFHCVLPIRTGE